ncbi:MAG: sugar ABC transporter substrate-binding protein [Burkholderiales bacterium RIFCSPLOWO2_12_FULL_61_40]|nr:MAG: sugar ABC transporter substrate-binding protein [Burkholderiales bacterium RIFCSPLOWO2_12_FULL_61_40]
MKTRRFIVLMLCPLWVSAHAATELVVATVNNSHMVTMQKLSPVFERDNPDIKVKWMVMQESELRARVSADITNKSGAFDVVTIGMYETPIWAKKGWLEEIKPDAKYDVRDILPAMRDGLSHQGKLYAAPFYGESSMTMYRHDLLEKAGLGMPSQPTWEHIRTIAAKVNHPSAGVYGICLRGKPGWGDNMALVSTMVNAFGGQWFDMAWKPQIDTVPWKNAVSFYVDLLQKYGPPDAVANSFNENLNLFNAGKCAMWIDATIAASFITDPQKSKVADKVAFAQAPSAVTSKGASWLWAWALAIPSVSAKTREAQRFIRWATSKEYVQLVGSQMGWNQVPTGTRISTYRNANFIKGSRWAYSEASAIALSNPTDATLLHSPYVGIQFAAIPEFQVVGQATGIFVNEALAGKRTVTQALQAAQLAADQEMRKAGYYK